MKRLLPIGLLALLLYNMFGLTYAVLFFEKDYQISSLASADEEVKVIKMHLPSLPYAGDLQIAQAPEGLIRQDDNFYNASQVLHENDTLYVTLKSNQAARDHFVALANAMELLNEPAANDAQNPYNQAIKLLNDLVKHYTPNDVQLYFHPGTFVEESLSLVNVSGKDIYSAIFMQLPNPPPERC